MPNRFSEIKALLDSLEPDFVKFFDKKNKTAGIRLRKGLQSLRSMAQEIRMSVQAEKQQRKTSGKRP